MGIILAVALALAVSFLVYLIFQQKRQNKKLAAQYQNLEQKFLHIVSSEDVKEPLHRSKRKTRKIETCEIIDAGPVELAPKPAPAPVPAPPKPVQPEIQLPPRVATITKEISERITSGSATETTGGLMNPETVVENWHYVPVEQEVPASIRERILERDHHSCRYCGSKADLTITNILPTYRRGIFSEVTLVTSCRSCQTERTDSAVSTGRAEPAKRMAS
jgi:5-methylcytosine-specific restriction endonuclease McrA